MYVKEGCWGRGRKGLGERGGRRPGGGGWSWSPLEGSMWPPSTTVSHLGSEWCCFDSWNFHLSINQSMNRALFICRVSLTKVGILVLDKKKINKPSQLATHRRSWFVFVAKETVCGCYCIFIILHSIGLRRDCPSGTMQPYVGDTP